MSKDDKLVHLSAGDFRAIIPSFGSLGAMEAMKFLDVMQSDDSTEAMRLAYVTMTVLLDDEDREAFQALSLDDFRIVLDQWISQSVGGA